MYHWVTESSTPTLRHMEVGVRATWMTDTGLPASVCGMFMCQFHHVDPTIAGSLDIIG